MPEGDLKEPLEDRFDPNMTPDSEHIEPMEFKLADLRKGFEDPRGRMVHDILWAVDAFKIYKTDHGISPFFSDNPELAEKQRHAYLELGAGIAEFNHLIRSLQPANVPFTDKAMIKNAHQDGNLKHFERELSRCIAQALLGQVDIAKKSLADLRTRLAARISNRGRVVHLLINIVLVAIAITGGLIFARSGYQSTFGFNVKEMGLAVMMGSVGALFSTTARLQRMEVDPMITNYMHWVYGGQRVLVGALGGMVLYFGIKSGIVSALFAPLEKSTSVSIPAQGPSLGLDTYWLSFVCMLAGFSERLVPNLLDAKARDMGAEKDG